MHLPAILEWTAMEGMRAVTLATGKVFHGAVLMPRSPRLR
jgi:hypothetical protein